MDINPIILSIPVYFLLIGIELVIQAFQKRKIYRLNDALTNISCGITQQLTGVFFKVLAISAYQLVYEYLAIWHIEATWYNLIILFILVDFFYYWAHRKSHEINLFWGGHVVHHQSEDYNFSVALRQGSFQVLFTFFFYFPLAVMGFDTLSFVLMSGLVTVYQFWIHTETIGKLGPVEWIFNTPSHHRVHHGRNPKYIDRNHAGVFIIWDRMFGTFQEEEERPTYGITKPTNSWNPVWVNLQHYVDLWHTLKKADSFKDKLGITFRKPGWLPEYLGGYQAPPPVEKDKIKKYDAHPFQRGAVSYIFIQYVLLLATTAFFLFQEAQFPLISKIWVAGWIIWGITNLGGLIELSRWARYSELLRLFSMVSIAWILVGGALTLSNPVFWGAIVLSFYSILHLYFSILRAPAGITSSPANA